MQHSIDPQAPRNRMIPVSVRQPFSKSRWLVSAIREDKNSIKDNSDSTGYMKRNTAYDHHHVNCSVLHQYINMFHIPPTIICSIVSFLIPRHL